MILDFVILLWQCVNQVQMFYSIHLYLYDQVVSAFAQLQPPFLQHRSQSFFRFLQFPTSSSAIQTSNSSVQQLACWGDSFGVKRDLDSGGAGISVKDTLAMPGIFIRGTAAVEIPTLLSVLRNNGIRCTSIKRKDGGFKLFCDSQCLRNRTASFITYRKSHSLIFLPKPSTELFSLLNLINIRHYHRTIENTPKYI